MRCRSPALLLRKARTARFRRLITCTLSMAIVYLVYSYNIWEYARTTSFAYFSYPLEVDMPELVKRVLNNQPAGVEPLNDRHAFPFVLNAGDKCKDEDGNKENVFLLILVKSALENLEQRRTIRRTWGREFGVASVTVRCVFLLGVHPTNQKFQHKISVEQQDFGDIVQQDFHDMYYNNTLKMMMGFQWATEYCENARFVAFFDDDYFVNINNVVKMLEAVKPTEYDNLIIGFLYENAMPLRRKDSKWYVSLDEYQYRYFPKYATAGSLFLPMMTAARVYAAMQFTKVMRFDDVFLGIVALKLRITLQRNDNVFFYDHPYDRFAYRTVIAAHGFKDTELLYRAWKEQTDLDWMERAADHSRSEKLVGPFGLMILAFTVQSTSILFKWLAIP